MAETVPQTAAGLKAYFQTGETPTADQFSEWIDTMFYYIQGVFDSANAAAASAAAAAASAATNPIASCYIQYNGGAPVLQGVSKNIASVQLFVLGGGSAGYQINFANAMPNTFYKPHLVTTAQAFSAGAAAQSSVWVMQQTLNFIIVAVSSQRDVVIDIFP